MGRETKVTDDKWASVVEEIADGAERGGIAGFVVIVVVAVEALGIVGSGIGSP